MHRLTKIETIIIYQFEFKISWYFLIAKTEKKKFCKLQDI